MTCLRFEDKRSGIVGFVCHGREFCSFKCFSKRALDWVREVEKSA